MLISYSYVAQEKKQIDYQFIGDYVFARKLIVANAVLSIENQVYAFGVINNEDKKDTTWMDPFSYKLLGNKVYVLSNGQEYLQYSDNVGDTVFSLFEYISPTSGFVATRFIDGYRYKSRECIYYENEKIEPESNKTTTVVCILDKDLKLPVYYEITISKFAKTSLRLIYFSELKMKE